MRRRRLANTGLIVKPSTASSATEEEVLHGFRHWRRDCSLYRPQLDVDQGLVLVLALHLKLDDLLQNRQVEDLDLGFGEDLLPALGQLRDGVVELFGSLDKRADTVARAPNGVGHGFSLIKPD